MSAEEARAEAERRYGLMGGDTHGPSLHAFIAGAEWQASREVTEAEVEDVRAALVSADFAYLSRSQQIAAGLDADPEDYLTVLARAALEATREVRS